MEDEEKEFVTPWIARNSSVGRWENAGTIITTTRGSVAHCLI